MKKIRKTTTIYLPHNNHAKCPIYEHEGKFYIKANKYNTQSFNPFRYEGVEYSEVENLPYNGEEYWFLK